MQLTSDGQEMGKSVTKPKGEGLLGPATCSTTGTHIIFEELTPNPATKRWAVMPKDRSPQIGVVSWYGPWRKYCYTPMANTVYEQVCLREIAGFCENQTQLHRRSCRTSA